MVRSHRPSFQWNDLSMRCETRYSVYSRLYPDWVESTYSTLRYTRSWARSHDVPSLEHLLSCDICCHIVSAHVGPDPNCGVDADKRLRASPSSSSTRGKSLLHDTTTDQWRKKAETEQRPHWTECASSKHEYYHLWTKGTLGKPNSRIFVLHVECCITGFRRFDLRKFVTYISKLWRCRKLQIILIIIEDKKKGITNVYRYPEPVLTRETWLTHPWPLCSHANNYLGHLFSLYSPILSHALSYSPPCSPSAFLCFFVIYFYSYSLETFNDSEYRADNGFVLIKELYITPYPIILSYSTYIFFLIPLALNFTISYLYSFFKFSDIALYLYNYINRCNYIIFSLLLIYCMTACNYYWD